MGEVDADVVAYVNLDVHSDARVDVHVGFCVNANVSVNVDNGVDTDVDFDFDVGVLVDVGVSFDLSSFSGVIVNCRKIMLISMCILLFIRTAKNSSCHEEEEEGIGVEASFGNLR